MKKSVILFAVLVFALSACSTMQMGSSGAKSVATGSAGGANASGANPQLQRCARPFGTLAVNEEQTADWYPWLHRYGMESTVPVLRLLAQQSNCFVVVERGSGMHMMTRERELQRSGELRAHSHFGKGQMVAADYTVTSNLLVNAHNTGGIGSAVGGLFGSIGAAIGGSLSTSDAQSMLTLVDNRSGVQVAVAEGSGRSMDIGGLMGMFGSSAGGALSAYTSTPQGKVVLASMTDAFNNMVIATKNYAPQQAPTANGLGTGGRLKVN